MTSRPLIRWLLFSLSLAIFVGAMLWVTQRTLQMEHQRHLDAAEEEANEKARLALWRMEAEASAVVVRESARPAHHYQPFHTLEDWVIQKDQSIPQGGVRLPSPLLGTTPEMVRLHFERTLGQAASFYCSPQTPVGSERTLALERYEVDREVTAATRTLAELEKLLLAHRGWEVMAGFDSLEIGPTVAQGPSQNLDTTDIKVAGKNALNFRDQAWRDNTLLQNAIQQQAQSIKTPAMKSAQVRQPRVLVEEIGPMKAIWLGRELLLIRRVRLQGTSRMQGVWLDWPGLESRLLAAARDLLPAATLQPVDSAAMKDDWMTLVTLPVRLVPGSLTSSVSDETSALKPALALAWGCLIIAAIAIAIVLHRAMQLSERRAAFVSAVTHELRSPLTTFRLYSEMLAEDMVPDATQRKTYLRTLCEESTRLAHLVENVLSFSRIERGRAPARLTPIAVGILLSGLKPRLLARAEQAALEFNVAASETALQASITADATAVEQVLFNLVDNACKYAAHDSKPPRLDLVVAIDSGSVLFTVRDHGPGLNAMQRRKLFLPFSKSATEAAHSAPGVGLGLALSRRLAREMGGELSYAPVEGRGAAFSLRLKLAKG